MSEKRHGNQVNNVSDGGHSSGTKKNGDPVSRNVSKGGKQSVTERLTGIITHTFPKNSRERATSLLVFLLKYGKDVFQVHGSGRFRIHGREMDSSIVDYIYCSLLSEKAHHQPRDFNYFQDAMDQISVPGHLSKKTNKNRDLSVKTKSRKWLPY